MHWSEYAAAFAAGAVLANFVPHFVHGISGNRFPTPFATPPGRGLSSPTVNVLWALFNLILGLVLLRYSRVSLQINVPLAVFVVGVAFLSIPMSVHFQKKEKA